MLRAEHPWRATVAVPGSTAGPGVWAPLLTRQDVTVRMAGRAHTAGATQNASLLGRIRFLRQVFGQAWHLLRARPAKNVDLVHANTTRAALYCTIACFGLKLPVVVHLRDMVDPESLGGLGFALMSRFVLPRASGVIANSRATLVSAQRFIGDDVPRTVIASASGITIARSAPPVSGRVRRVGMVARIDTWKGQDLLIEAFSRAFEGTDASLHLAGSADFGKRVVIDQLRSLARRLGIEDRVVFHGHVDDVASFIDSVDVCVQASTRSEPLGQNVLQYLAAGKPTIATSAGGPGEWIVHGHNGMTFEMGDVDSLTKSLIALQSSKLRRALSAHALETPGLATDEQIAVLHHDFFLHALGRKDTTDER